MNPLRVPCGYRACSDHTTYSYANEFLVSRSARNQEFRDCSKGQRSDLLFRAFPWLAQIAERLPHSRHRNLVRRHDQTVWLPSSLEQLRRVGDAPASADSGGRENSAPTPGPAAADDPDQESNPGDEGHAVTARREVRSLPPFGREELDLIVIDEGARAEYDVYARERPFWAGVSGALYLFGALLIVWLVVRQAESILCQGDKLSQPFLSPHMRWLVLGMLTLYLVGGIAWIVGKTVTALRDRRARDRE